MANLLFDYDGTLHETIRIYAAAFRAAYDRMVADGLAEPRDWEEREITRWLGYTAKDMWESFAPTLPEEKKLYYSGLIGTGLVDQIRAGNARLYPGAEDVLRTLKSAGHQLFFLSNCRTTYLAVHREQFRLDRFFTDFYCSEDYDWDPKPVIFARMQEKWPGDWIVIGDRHHDLEVAEVFHLPSIGCRYGYGAPGELDAATRLADRVTDIPELVRQLVKS